MGALIEATLRSVEVSIYQAFTGVEGLRSAYELHPDLVILDVMMPEMDGFGVCTRLREISSVPILMLTARGTENDLQRGFNIGADDFVKKPFKKNELEARVRALLRRSNRQEMIDSSYITAYSDGVLEIDLVSGTVRLCGHIVDLSVKEYDLLACLVREQGKIVSHRELAREVWGDMHTNGNDLASLYVCYLRKKLQDGQHGHRYIHTLWGRGYWFEPRKEA
jgi:DNA-binding response OmpR family regulator